MGNDRGFQFTDDAVPTEYDEVLVPRLFEPWAALLLDDCELDKSAVVLDVATGPGTVARLAAKRIGRGGRVVATDVSRPMLRVASSKPTLLDAAPITYIESPAAPLAVASAAFDLVICQQGLQFFPDRPAALSEMRRALKPGGGLAIAVWCHIADNSIYAALHAALRDSVPTDLADRLLAPFGWPHAQLIKDAIEAAGFRAIRARRAVLPLIFDGGIAQAAPGALSQPARPISCCIARNDAGYVERRHQNASRSTPHGGKGQRRHDCEYLPLRARKRQTEDHLRCLGAGESQRRFAMTTDGGHAMEQTFKSLEHQGWNERASAYDAYTARFTSYGIEPLLQATGIAPEQAVLDVCCGTGLLAEAATGRGASVIGVDISEEMIATAKAKGLACQFQVGDAEALPFGDVHFDRVICNFGLYHLPEPDRAIAEAARVLRPDGVYAFTTWCGPDVSPLFRVVAEAIEAHGKMDVGLPPAPPPFRLADRTESVRATAAAGFGDVSIVDVPAVFECKRDEVIDFLEKSTVRLTMMLQAQSPSARAAIDRAIREKLATFAAEDMLRLPMPAILVRGVKRADKR